MMVRALLVSALTTWGLYLSPVMPPVPPKSSPTASAQYAISTWGIEAQAQIQLSRHSPQWWKRQFKQQSLKGITHNFVFHNESSTNYHDAGAVIYRKTAKGHQTETLIPNSYNETIRHSYLIKKIGKAHKPSWWPKHFEFYGATKIAGSETAYGRITNSNNLCKHLPKQGQPWVQIGENFYLGKATQWWAFAQKGELRIIHLGDE